MFFNKPFKFYKGYVIIGIRGEESERFINICTRRSIRLRDITALPDGEISARAEAADFARMRSAAGKCRVRVRIIGKRTAATAFDAARYRVGFIIGLFAFAAFWAVSSGFIWKVKVEGNISTPTEAILSSAEGAGLYSGARKNGIPSGETLKYIIMNENPAVSWAWVYINGSKATVKVFEGAPVPEITDESEGSDIIAGHDGMITSITVKKGYALVSAGDGVTAGEILVSGLVPAKTDEEGNPSEYRIVHADADITADTWYEKSMVYPLSYTTRTATGAQRRRYTLKLFSKSVPLYRDESPPFEEYSRDTVSHELSPFGKFTGISLDEEIFSEYSTYTEPLSEAAAAELAGTQLEEGIGRELFAGAVLLDKSLDWTKEDGSVRVTLTMRFSQSIGIQLPHKRSELQFDSTND